MKYCTRCLYSENHPLTITFDKDGVCSGCRVHNEKFETMDWVKKEEEFTEILSHYKGKKHSSYDCIIPVTGTGDDFYVVDLIKNKHGLNPLLVSYNIQTTTKMGIRNLARLCTKLDCDHIGYTVGPDTVKRLTKITLERMGHVYWHTLAGSLTFPVQLGTKFNIPLIVWGAHTWSDQVGMFSHFDAVEMTKKVRKEHSLKMCDAESLKGIDPELSDKDLMAFTYPTDAQLEKCRVRGVYVSNYYFWDSQDQIERMIEKYGYETCEQERTFNNYETVHCNVVEGVHDYLKYLKFGYGKATDHACRDIRLKRMTRLDGIELVEKYDHIIPKSVDKFCEWLGVTKDYFFEQAEKHRNLDIWDKDESGEWKLKSSLRANHENNLEKIEKVKLEVNDRREYKLTPVLEEPSDEFILTGRLYMDEYNFKAIEG